MSEEIVLRVLLDEVNNSKIIITREKKEKKKGLNSVCMCLSLLYIGIHLQNYSLMHADIVCSLNACNVNLYEQEKKRLSCDITPL
jgi:hypothetical protein